MGPHTHLEENPNLFPGSEISPYAVLNMHGLVLTQEIMRSKDAKCNSEELA